MINYNEKYDFKSDYVQLSSKDIEALISPLLTKSSLKNHSILNGGYSNTNYKYNQRSKICSAQFARCSRWFLFG